MLTQMVYPNFIINSSPSHHRCLSISLMSFICGATAEEGKNFGVEEDRVRSDNSGAIFQDGWVWLVSIPSLVLKLHVGFISVSPGSHRWSLQGQQTSIHKGTGLGTMLSLISLGCWDKGKRRWVTNQQKLIITPVKKHKSERILYCWGI